MNRLSLYVRGYSFFAPDYATPADAFADVRRSATAPNFAMIEGRLRRFTSLVTQMHLDVAGEALRSANVAASEVVSVFASSWGEITTAETIMRSIFDDGSVSAARFTQSVHNTPSGIFSIAANNHRPSSTIAAGLQTCAMGFLEALTLQKDEGGDVLLTLADEEIPSVFRAEVRPSLAVAFVLSEKSEGAHAKVSLIPAPKDGAPEEVRVLENDTLPAHLRPSAVALGVALVRFLAAKDVTPVTLRGASYAILVEPA